ncbi:regulator of chromosome condensation 1/beta-lactamase-inhibitor protein II [Kockovaella imperatae]|uniref:Regulator of chromosome condensation 1/beta-lactamase-inhibitor protein II n=1 Tax=Kockovaella imperatae TaxID=4999 RepID=A0A1Y1URM7_9TREE|nr:regulator of chromosome condensation 1/beta-lactamase-inhibitor protein II [Kockovaella imperatae]ORX40708.1 regulator of chromosome condensation 1/beta-lactamase-inhibitor protein II [Kockovaella imperatae]
MPLRLLSCGSNPSGQLSLGHSDDVHQYSPCHFHPSIEHLLKKASILDLVSSSSHSLLLLSTEVGNVLLGAGTNTLGQLGPRCALWADVSPETKFKSVDLLGPAGFSTDEWTPVKIACTWTTSFVAYRKITRGDTVLSPVEQTQMVLGCGSNDFGELGHETILEGQASVAPSAMNLGLEPGEELEMICGGQRHVIAVIRSSDGGQRVVGWGAARKGELDPSRRLKFGSSKGKGQALPKSIPPTVLDCNLSLTNPILDIAVGTSHAVVLLSNGSLMSWGADTKGQITHLDDLGSVRRIGVTWNGSYTLSPSGIHSQGSNNHGQLLRPTEADSQLIPFPKEVDTFVCGSEHLLVLCPGNVDENELWTGGWNEHGNLGLGDLEDRNRLVKVPLETGKITGMWAGCAASWICMG